MKIEHYFQSSCSEFVYYLNREQPECKKIEKELKEIFRTIEFHNDNLYDDKEELRDAIKKLELKNSDLDHMNNIYDFEWVSIKLFGKHLIRLQGQHDDQGTKFLKILKKLKLKVEIEECD